MIRCCGCNKTYEIKIYEGNIIACPYCGYQHKVDFTPVKKEDEVQLKPVDEVRLSAAAPILVASCIFEGDWTKSYADNADVTNWPATNEFIIGFQLDEERGAWNAAYTLRWRDVTDAGSFAAISSTGECKWGSSTSLVNGSAVTARKLTATGAAGSTWQNGEQVEGAATSDAINLADEYYTEVHFAVNVSSAQAHEYEFEIYDQTNGASIGTAACTVTVTNDPPTVALGTPADNATISDTTPDLTFTGTDPENNSVAYQVQVDSATGFNSQSNDVVDSFLLGASYSVMYNGSYDWDGQTFTGDGNTLTSVELYVQKDSSPSGNAQVLIYNITGTSGVDGKPTGSPIATSDNFDVTSFPTSYAWVSFQFSGANQIALGNGTNYCLVLKVEGTTSDSTNRFRLGYDFSTRDDGNGFRSADGSSWTVESSYDFKFIVHNDVGNTPLISALSTDLTGFTTDADGYYASAAEVTYTVQSALSGAGPFYWRVRGKDNITGTWGAWSPGDSTLGYDHFHVSAGGGSSSVSVSDTASVTEDVVVLKPTQYISVYDQSAVTDVPFAGITPKQVNVYDSSAVTEGVFSAINKWLVSVFDSSGVTESITAFINKWLLSVFDSSSVTENVVALIPTLNLSVFDSSAVTESVTTQKNSYNIAVYDSTGVTEAIIALVPTRHISVYEESATTEDIVAEEITPSPSTLEISSVYDTSLVEDLSEVTSYYKIDVSDIIKVVDYQNYRGVTSAGGEFAADAARLPGTYDTDYSYDSATAFNTIASYGHKLIRLPFRWERIQPTRNAALNATELARLHTVVDNISAAGMKTVLDVHNYARYIVSGGAEEVLGTDFTSAALIDLWERLATEFKEDAGVYAYGLMNEPHDLASSSPYGSLITSDTFGTNLDNYTQTGTWDITGGTLNISANTGTDWANGIIITNTNTYTDFDLIARIKKGTGNCMVVFRSGNTGGSGYGIQLRADGGNRQLRLENWGSASLATADAGFTWTTGNWYKVRIRASGTNIKSKVWNDADAEPDSWHIDYTDSSNLHSSGSIGFSTENNLDASFDDLYVYETAAAQTGAEYWEAVSQELVDAIRAIDPNTKIMVPGYGWSGSQNWLTNHPDGWITDSNFSYEAHYYWDNNHSGAYADSYATTESGAVSDGYDDLADRVTTEVTIFTDWLTANGATGFLGEFGWPNNADTASWNAIGEVFYNILDASHLDAAYWSAGARWGTDYILSVYTGADQDTKKAQYPVVEGHPSVPSLSVSVSGIRVYDTSRVTESIVLFLNHFIAVFESTSVTEVIVSGTTPKSVVVYEETTVTEDTTLLLGSPSNFDVSVADTSAITEGLSTSVNKWLISIFDTSSVTENITVLIPTLTLSVFDSSAVTEEKTLSIVSPASFDISVVDTTTVTESISVLKTSHNVNIFDGTSITESITAFIDKWLVSVFDSSGVTEALTLFRASHNVSVFDSTGVTESVSNQPTSYNINVSETSAVTESIEFRFSLLNLNVYEISAVTEGTTLIVVSPGSYNINANDSTVVTEAHALWFSLFTVSVSETTTTTEYITHSIVSPASFNISVLETTTVTEAPTASPNLFNINVYAVSGLTEYVATVRVSPASFDVGVYDSSTVTDVTTVQLNALFISVNDASTISEATTVQQNQLIISVYDTSAITEYLITSVDHVEISGYDESGVTEYVTASMNLFNISVYDQSIVTDSNENNTPLLLIVGEDITVEDVIPEWYEGETVTLEEYVVLIIASAASYGINVYDESTATEDVTLTLVYPDSYNISVYDSAEVTENITVNPDHFNVNTYDESTATEAVTITFTSPEYFDLSVYEASTVTAEATLLIVSPSVFNINVKDSTAVTDASTFRLNLFNTSVSDTTLVSEYVVLSIVSPTSFDASVYDSSGVTESILLSLGSYNISSYEETAITEDVATEQVLPGSYDVSVYDETSVTEVIVLGKSAQDIVVYDTVGEQGYDLIYLVNRDTFAVQLSGNLYWELD